MDSDSLFHKDSSQIYRVRPLEEFGWLTHGFGTRSTPAIEGRNLATVRQVHSSRVVDAAGRTGCLGEGDALIGNTPGILLAVKTADCFPILLADPVHRAVGVVHAGWRGTAAKIVQNTVRALTEKFGARPEDLHAAIGPGIQQCCFEVGPEVAAEFGRPPAKAHLDLAEINQRQLIEAGLRPAKIHAAHLCTACRGDEFYSWRRDKPAGRMLSLVGLI